MRRSIVPLLLGLMLVALTASPVAADKPETKTVIPLDIAKEDPVWNPCTGELTRLEGTAEWDLHASPSIDSFFDGDFKHARGKFIGQFVGLDDGYATKWKPFMTAVINVNEKHDHYVHTETSNLMFYGEDGGKYRVHGQFRLVIVGGEVKVSSDFNEAFCVLQPTG